MESRKNLIKCEEVFVVNNHIISVRINASISVGGCYSISISISISQYKCQCQCKCQYQCQCDCQYQLKKINDKKNSCDRHLPNSPTRAIGAVKQNMLRKREVWRAYVKGTVRALRKRRYKSEEEVRWRGKRSITTQNNKKNSF